MNVQNIRLFIPCFVDQLYPHSAANMVKVLRKAGCEVSYNPAQTCCGQPAFNAGFWKEAKEVGEKFLRDFAGNGPIVAPSASCVGYVRNYFKNHFENGPLWKECQEVQANIFEFSEFLVDHLGITNFGAKLEGTATYHDSCAALRECKIQDAPRKLLSEVEGLTLLEMADTDQCCGFGGTFTVKFEPIAVAMGEQKIDRAVDTGAQYLISTDCSCLMHLNGYIQKFNRPIQPMHLADVLAQF
ncbi:MAG: (Fe-S)-binding protein [Elusimicrobiota bacterium]